MRDVNALLSSDPQMTAIWSDEGFLSRILEVEVAIARAHAKLGNIKPEHADEIANKATLEHVSWANIRARDKQLQHTMMSVVKTLEAACTGEAGEYVHYAVGTSEVTHTALGLQMRDTLALIRHRLSELVEASLRLTTEHQGTVMAGRSLGQQIVPYTLGLRFGVWTMELCRHLDRLQESTPRVAVGMIRGAVGSKAEQVALGAHTLQLEEFVLRDVGLEAPVATDQVLQGDRHIEFGSVLMQIGLTLDKIAWNIRTLQKSEVGEVEEPFNEATQVGSTDAPHKRNPRNSEIVCGLSKLAKGDYVALLDAARHEHEYDSSSAVVDAYALGRLALKVNAMLRTMTTVLADLRVYPERMAENLRSTDGRIMSTAILMHLAREGVGRQTAHELVRRAGQKSFLEGRPITETLMEDARVSAYLSPEVLKQLVEPATFLGNVDEQVAAVVRETHAALERADYPLGVPTTVGGGIT